VQVQTNEAKSEPKASLLRGRGEIAKAHPIPGTMAYKSQMSAEQAEDRLKDIFLKVKAGELPPVLVKEVMPMLVDVLAHKANASHADVEMVMQAVDTDKDGHLDRMEMTAALGGVEDTAVSAGDKQLKQEELMTGCNLGYSCCDDFHSQICEDIYFLPRMSLTNNIASPKGCYILTVLPGSSCMSIYYGYLYTNSDPNKDPSEKSGGMCRCQTSSDISWYQSKSGNDVSCFAYCPGANQNNTHSPHIFGLLCRSYCWLRWHISVGCLSPPRRPPIACSGLFSVLFFFSAQVIFRVLALSCFLN
jgi:hypothetical protein